MKIAIQGAGAVGLGLASALAAPVRPGRTEEPIRLIVRDPATRDAIARLGLVRSGLLGRVRVAPGRLRLETGPAPLADDPPDWLLVCTKAFASADVARALEPLANDLVGRTRLLLCQNGWGNEAAFLDFWPRAALHHARIITGFHRRRLHAVEVTAHAAPIALGSVFGMPTAVLEPLARRLDAGGLPCTTTDDMQGVLWAKMLYNCALNPLGALAGRRYGELVEDATTRRLVETVVHEIFAVLEKSPWQVAWPDADAYLEVFHRELLPPTRAHRSSMLQDLQAGRRTEIEALCGAVERIGREVDVETPVISALATLVRRAERRSLAGRDPGGDA